ncbi:PspC domain-containing protein [Herbidospora mongoliensis]|uniref:PspC domain-containing protein n=1 Tax=Herbidospora mongoliensis TaxID=688067 RepID=UPI000ADCBDAC|nr:PspC domain-containing protein [Herbidospora mongoliensis]
MTEVPPEENPPAGDPPSEPLSRVSEGRMLTGVCAGLGRFTGMDPVLFRVGFAVLLLGSGIGVILYIAAFLLMREPGGGPGYVEQWTRRIFDTETVMALLVAVFTLGLIVNLASGGIDRGTIVVGVLLAITLLAAHARGVDVLGLITSIPERLTGRRGMTRIEPVAVSSPSPASAFTVGGFTTGATGGNFRETVKESFRESYRMSFGRDPAPSSADPPGTAGESPATREYPAQEPPTQASPAQAAPAPSRAKAPDGYRRLSDLAYEARQAAYSAGEAFAPHGPFAKQAPAPPPPVRVPKAPKVKRRRSYVGGLTFMLALIVGGVMVAVQQPGTESVSLPMVGGAMLAVIGGGLLVATWFGRGAGLIALGVIVAVALVVGTSVTGIPKRVGSYSWHPTTVAMAERTYAVGVGAGELDLTDLELPPGARVRFDASVSLGQLTVVVPPDAIVEVHGQTRLGDIKIDHQVSDGTDVRISRTLTPMTAPEGQAATIELYVSAGVGDVEVRRGA